MNPNEEENVPCLQPCGEVGDLSGSSLFGNRWLAFGCWYWRKVWGRRQQLVKGTNLPYQIRLTRLLDGAGQVHR